MTSKHSFPEKLFVVFSSLSFVWLVHHSWKIVRIENTIASRCLLKMSDVNFIHQPSRTRGLFPMLSSSLALPLSFSLPLDSLSMYFIRHHYCFFFLFLYILLYRLDVANTSEKKENESWRQMKKMRKHLNERERSNNILWNVNICRFSFSFSCSFVFSIREQLVYIF